MEFVAKIASHPAYAAFTAAVGPYGPKIAALANPDLPYETSVTKDWALMKFSDAAAVALAYVVLVAFGLLFRKAPTGEKEEKLGFLAGVRKEPIKLLAVVYNLTQVRCL